MSSNRFWFAPLNGKTVPQAMRSNSPLEQSSSVTARLSTLRRRLLPSPQPDIACASCAPCRRPETEPLQFGNMTSHHPVAKAHSRVAQPSDLHIGASRKTRVQGDRQQWGNLGGSYRHLNLICLLRQCKSWVIKDSEYNCKCMAFDAFRAFFTEILSLFPSPVPSNVSFTRCTTTLNQVHYYSKSHETRSGSRALKTAIDNLQIFLATYGNCNQRLGHTAWSGDIYFASLFEKWYEFSYASLGSKWCE